MLRILSNKKKKLTLLVLEGKLHSKRSLSSVEYNSQHKQEKATPPPRQQPREHYERNKEEIASWKAQPYSKTVFNAKHLLAYALPHWPTTPVNQRETSPWCG